MSLRENFREWTQGRWAYAGAGIIGFLEGSVLIIAPEPLLIPAMLSHKRTIWLFALLPALGNVVAGLLMYALGAYLAEPVIEPFVEWMGATEDYQQAIDDLKANGFLALFIVGVTPFPFQIGTAAAGAAGYNLGLFILAVAVSRSLRYLFLAGLVRIIGASAREWIEKRHFEIFLLGLVLFAAVAVGMFLL